MSRHLTAAVLTLGLPVLLVFTGLVAGGALSWHLAIPAAILILGPMLLLLRRHVADLSALARYARDWGRTDPPAVSSEMAEDMLAALGLVRRQFRTQAEESIAQVRGHEALLDGLPEPLLLVNGLRRIVRTNQPGHHLFGRDLNGRDLAVVLRHPQLLEIADRALQGEAADALPGGGVTEIHLAPQKRDYRVVLAPLDHVGLDGARLVITLHDISALKRVEQMRADFVANASHELRTPLAGLLGFIETLRGPARDDPDAQERFLAIMQDQAERMTRLVADLLTLSRVEMNEATPPLGRVEVPPVLRRVCAGLEITAAGRAMTLVPVLDESLPAIIGSDDEVTQILQNLIDNALKYGRSGTNVTITVRRAGPPWPAGLPALPPYADGVLSVAVADQGEGIAAEHLPRLTERFFRVDTARSRRMGGTGLGLAIVKHMVARHRGCLTISSEPGQGSVFTVYLPAMPKGFMPDKRPDPLAVLPQEGD